jgi:hypothetical protein
VAGKKHVMSDICIWRALDQSGMRFLWPSQRWARSLSLIRLGGARNRACAWRAPTQQVGGDGAVLVFSVAKLISPWALDKLCRAIECAEHFVQRATGSVIPSLGDIVDRGKQRDAPSLEGKDRRVVATIVAPLRPHGNESADQRPLLRSRVPWVYLSPVP